MKGLGTNDDTLIEIISFRPPRILRQVIEKFKEKYNIDFEAYVKCKTSGTLRTLLFALLQCHR